MARPVENDGLDGFSESKKTERLWLQSKSYEFTKEIARVQVLR